MRHTTRTALTRYTRLCTASLLVCVIVGCHDRTVSATPNFIAERLPRVLYRGGPFLRHPRIVTITFHGDDPAVVARLEMFGDTITRSSWWHAVTEGYCAQDADCIGQGQTGEHVRLTAALSPEIRDVDIESLLTREAQGDHLGPLDADTLLLTYLPKGVGLADAFIQSYCAGGPRAFHRALALKSARVAFAVLPRCGGEGELTATASHEILEAATNPDPASRGFAFDQGSATLGFTAAGIEPVDPCGLITSDTHRTIESGVVLQRAWSNRAASLGRDPCVPAAASDQPYLALVPREPTVRLVSPGDTATIALDAASDRPVAAWEVSALDLTGARDREQYVDAVLDKSQVATGQTASLTLAMRRRHPRGVVIVGIVSRLGNHSDIWPVAVVMR